MFKTILAATDMITLMDAPVLAAIDFARKNRSMLHILHVLESGSLHERNRVRHFETNEEIIADAAYHDLVAAQLKKTYTPAAGKDVRIRYETATGFPWKKIIRNARKVKSDLIVMGPHSAWAQKKGVVRATGKIGSTVQGVVTRENCPVMIVKKKLPEGFHINRMVVGIDFSQSSECAVCFAAKLSRSSGATVFPFFMLPVPPYPKFTKVEYEANREKFLSKLVRFCDFYLDGTNHEYRIQSGILPHQEILMCAANVEADLILLGSHTKNKSGKWYVGSVVEKVSFNADCPVMAINDPDALRPWEDTKLSEELMPPQERCIHMF